MENPHAHGVTYVPRNPDFDYIVKDEDMNNRMESETTQHNAFSVMMLRITT